MNDMNHAPLPAEHSKPLRVSEIASEPVSRPHPDNLVSRIMGGLDAELSRPRTNGAKPAPRASAPRETAMAKMAGAGITSIAETVIKRIRDQMAEVDALRDTVHAEGNALIENLQRAVDNMEAEIRRFSELTQSVQLAFNTAANDVTTFNGKD